MTARAREHKYRNQKNKKKIGYLSMDDLAALVDKKIQKQRSLPIERRERIQAN